MIRIIISSICLTGFLGLAWAQPTLTSDLLLTPGESVPVQYFNIGSGVFDAGPSGANVNWDFSVVNKDGDPINWLVEDPAIAGLDNEFPDADYMVSVPNDSGQTYSFYGFDGTDFSSQGNIFVYQDGSDTLRQRFQASPTLELQLPTNFGDQITNVSIGQVTLVANGSTLLIDRTITRTIKADAYGSLTTPFGTFTDVLRVRIAEKIQDEVFGFPSNEQTNARYFWYSPSEKYLLLQMDSLVVNTLVADFPSFVMFYRSGAVSTTSVNEQLATDWQFTLYPNPASREATMTLELDRPRHLSVSLQSMQGQLIFQSERDVPAGAVKWPLELGDLEAGIYLLQLSSAEGRISRPLIIR